MYSDYSLPNALRIKLSRTHSHDNSYSHVAVNFHAWTLIVILDVAVEHTAT